MGIVTKIEPQKRNTERFNVFINGKYSFAVSIDVFTRFKIKKNQELSDLEIKEIVTEELYVKSFNKILDFISYQPRTKKEITQKINTLFYNSIENQGLKESLKGRILERLEDLNLYDDLNYAQAYIRQKTEAAKPLSANKLKEFLYKKGISPQIINAVLEEYTEDTQLKGAIFFAEKKLKNLKKYGLNDKKQRLWRYLASKGYSSSVVSAAVDTVLNL